MGWDFSELYQLAFDAEEYYQWAERENMGDKI
jgi:hypothetical protein